ncbi:MlaE family ABC transporter permease [Belliella aquatica]|uniref:ABC transporter permease protein n=1 Tax=Belliella aquatica TaxID=1323734 RepID=A0ABQ1MG26_9BACT|nr:ABC transporter permease [Belliella aquatica]MCH7405665.1 ABC transporter permease [Belliella aquatica]GGC36831.1 putative ABC transporter permease protein [Belliella aquatica]
MSETIERNRPVISKKIDKFFVGLADAFNFVKRFFQEVWFPPYEFKEILRQCYEIGYRSLPLISLTGFIVGIVFTNQSRPSLSEFGAASWLPALISIAIIRAMGPLVTALIAAGKVGSSIGAEIGSMKVTEQIDAMEVSAINPFKYLVVTRTIATTLMIPILVLYVDFVALMGSFINVNQNELVSLSTFFVQVFEAVSFLDVFSSIIKSLVFGFTIGIVGCYKGYNSSNGTEGVGKAANASVVMSMFLIFIEELLALQIVNAIRYA